MGESSPEQPPLSKGLILDRLFSQAEALGVDIEERDLPGLVGEDDNDFLGNLTSLALENGLDPDELFYRLGVAVEPDDETE